MQNKYRIYVESFPSTEVNNIHPRIYKLTGRGKKSIYLIKKWIQYKGFFFPFMAGPVAYGSSWARGCSCRPVPWLQQQWIQTTSIPMLQSAATLDP